MIYPLKNRENYHSDVHGGVIIPDFVGRNVEESRYLISVKSGMNASSAAEAVILAEKIAWKQSVFPARKTGILLSADSGRAEIEIKKAPAEFPK